MSNEELRAMYKERLKREKQYYIAEVTGIDKAILSRFKNNKIDLYPHLFKNLNLICSIINFNFKFLTGYLSQLFQKYFYKLNIDKIQREV